MPIFPQTLIIKPFPNYEKFFLNTEMGHISENISYCNVCFSNFCCAVFALINDVLTFEIIMTN